jgi:hypothetical protein
MSSPRVDLKTYEVGGDYTPCRERVDERLGY